MLRLARLDDAVPAAVAVSPLAVWTNTPVEKLKGGTVVPKEPAESVTL
jgi:hypothetical protein